MRNEILTAIIEQQQKVVDDVKKNIEILSTTSDLDEENTIDLDDLSHQAEAKDKEIDLAYKLDEEEDALTKLQTVIGKNSETVEPGAVVELDDQYLYVGVPFEPFNFKGKKIIGFSKQAPVFEQNKDKKKGDTFILGNDQKEIVNIY